MRFIKIIIFGFIAISCNAFALNLDGTWKSDFNSTVEFNSVNARLEDKQKSFLSELFGKLLVTYDNGVMKLSMPSAKVTVKGQLQDFEGFEQIQTYKVVIKNKDTIVLETTDEEGKKDIALLKFEGEDKYWIYLPTSSNDWMRLHIREYFVRQK